MSIMRVEYPNESQVYCSALNATMYIGTKLREQERPTKRLWEPLQERDRKAHLVTFNAANLCDWNVSMWKPLQESDRRARLATSNAPRAVNSDTHG